MSQAVAHFVEAADQAEAVWFTGCLATIPAAGAKTGGKLAIVEFTHPAGYATPSHVHHDADEAFYVLSGAMRGYCGDQKWRAEKGGFVWLPRGIPHGYAVDGEETLRTLAITVPGGFDRFVVEGGEPAQERHLPSAGPVDIEKVVAAGNRHSIEILGPPVF